MLRKVVIGATIVVICATTALVLWSLRRADGEVEPESSEERAQRGAPVERRLRALEKRLAWMSLRESSRGQQMDQRSPSVLALEESSRDQQPRTKEAPEAPEPETEAGHRALQQQQITQALAAEKKHFERLYQQFASEPVDGAWADGVKASLSKSFDGSALAKLGSMAIACRTSYCAIEVNYTEGRSADPASQREMASWLDGQECGFHVPGYVATDGEPVVKQRIYLDCAKRRRN